MIYYNGQIINPERFRVPSYNISPFSNSCLPILNDIFISETIDFDILNKKFGSHDLKLNGKSAIYDALSFYSLKSDDEVYIVTSTGNIYVSSCVTNEIEKYCRWSRKLSKKTKLIFVIHEFGLIYPDMDSLIGLNIPIIEDLAMSLFSTDEKRRVGRYGDFAIYSLPKFFPVQFGGVLQYNNDLYKRKAKSEEESFVLYLRKIVSFFLKHEKEIIMKRKSNYLYFIKKIHELGFQERLCLNSNETPSVFMFSSKEIDLLQLKVYMQNNGVESSVFYGEEAFFLPVHQNLNTFDLDYIFNLIKYFIDDKS